MDLRSPRIVFEEPVLLQAEGIDASIVGRARNLSEGGLFVGDLQDLPPMDSQLQLSFALPDGQAIEAEAKVTRRILTDSPLEPQGIALSFSSVVGEYAEHLRDFIDEERTSPGVDHDKIKLKLDQPDVVVSATARSVSDDLLVAECSLPFLRVGSELMVQRTDGQAPQPGVMSWVSMHLPPQGQVPKIIIGVDTSGRGADEVVAASNEAQAPITIVDQKPRRDDPSTLLMAAPHFTPVRPQRNTGLKLALAASLGALTLMSGWVVGRPLLAGLNDDVRQATIAAPALAPTLAPAPVPVVEAELMEYPIVAPTPAVDPQPVVDLPPVVDPQPAAVVDPAVARRQAAVRRSQLKRRRAKLKEHRARRRRQAAVKVLLTRAENARSRGRATVARRLALEALELEASNLKARALLLSMWRDGKTPRP
jgi:PilZ domain